MFFLKFLISKDLHCTELECGSICTKQVKVRFSKGISFHTQKKTKRAQPGFISKDWYVCYTFLNTIHPLSHHFVTHFYITGIGCLQKLPNHIPHTSTPLCHTLSLDFQCNLNTSEHNYFLVINIIQVTFRWHFYKDMLHQVLDQNPFGNIGKQIKNTPSSI